MSEGSGSTPDGWTQVSLDAVSTIVDCKHVTAPFLLRGFPVASIGELGSRLVDLTHAPRTTLEYYKLLTDGARRPQPGDLIMSRNATVGRVARVSNEHPPFAMGQDVCLLRPKTRACSPAFLQAFLRSTRSRSQLDAMMAGSTFKRINIQQIKRMEVLLPPIREQQLISEVLACAEDSVSTYQRLVAKKQAIKQGMMQQLLTGQTRLPGYTAPWAATALGSVASATMGQSPAGSSYNADGRGVPLVQGNADIRDRVTIDRIWTTAPTKRCRMGDVLLTVRAPVGYTAVASKDCCLGRGVCALSADRDNRYLFHALVYAEPKWMLYQQGTTFTAVNSNVVRSFELAWPTDRAERAAIAEALDDADSALTALRARLAKARAVKQGMMQELLTGRTRLPVTEGTE